MAELDKLAQFSNYMTLPATWPEWAQRAMKPVEYMDWVRGQISADFPFLMSEEEASAAAEQEQEQQADQTLNEGVAQAIPQVINQGLQEL